MSIRIPNIPRQLGGIQGQLETMQNEAMGALGSLGDIGAFGGPAKVGRQYGSTGFTYPMDMGMQSNAELDNHVIFEIYYDEGTQFPLEGTAGEPRAHTLPGGAGIGNMGVEAIQNAVNTVADSAVGEAVAAGTGAAVDALSGLTGVSSEQATEATGNFLSGMFSGARNLKKLNSQIALAVPNTLVATSTANYTEAKMGAVAGLLSRMGSGNMGNESIAEMGGQAARLAMETFAQLPDAFGMNLQNILEVTTRRVQNPHIEQRFESVSFREFSFVYEFAPKSKAEADAVNNIIQTFRFHMHPELVPGGLYFDYPSLFDISVMFKEGPNPYIHRISTCYLTSFTTNYTSTGVFSTTRDGAPTEVQVTMNFREIEPLHKLRIQQGF